jgi:hypothetical protein
MPCERTLGRPLLTIGGAVPADPGKIPPPPPLAPGFRIWRSDVCRCPNPQVKMTSAGHIYRSDDVQ